MNVIGLTVLSRQRYVVAFVTTEYVIKIKLSKHGSWDGLSMTCFTTCNLKIILDRKSNEKNHQDPFWINLLKVVINRSIHNLPICFSWSARYNLLQLPGL